MTVALVTGVGGGVGQSIIKSLQDTSYTVIGADGELLGTGLYAVTKAYSVPYVSAPGYIERLIEICQSNNCSLIFPGLDAELLVLSREAHKFREMGVIPIVSPSEIVEIADDKLQTYQFLTNSGFKAPLTFPLSDNITRYLPFPIIIKPKKGGARSKGVFVISNESELSSKLSSLDLKKYVAQEYIEGDEYTCGTINFEGRCYGSIVMRRILREGDTYKAFVVKDSYINTHIRAVAEVLKPFGSCNFQLRVKDGEPYIFEINARCSGTTYSRTLAGFNEPLMIADYLLYGKLPTYEIQEISILRYWKELVVDNVRIRELQEHGTISSNGSRL